MRILPLTLLLRTIQLRSVFIVCLVQLALAAHQILLMRHCPRAATVMERRRVHDLRRSRIVLSESAVCAQEKHPQEEEGRGKTSGNLAPSCRRPRPSVRSRHHLALVSWLNCPKRSLERESWAKGNRIVVSLLSSQSRWSLTAMLGRAEEHFSQRDAPADRAP